MGKVYEEEGEEAEGAEGAEGNAETEIVEATEAADVYEDGEEAEGEPEGEQADAEALKEVADMVDTAAAELQDVLEDNPELKEALQKSLEEIKEALKSSDPALLENAVEGVVKSFSKEDKSIVSSHGSTATLLRAIDSKVLLQLEDAEKQAHCTAKTIAELKQSVASLLKNPHMTEVENMELEEKNEQLSKMLKEFEIRTRQIQQLVGQIDKNADLLMPGYGLGMGIETKKPAKEEEMLPKVIICGTVENNMPKIIICDVDKKKQPKPKKYKVEPPPAPSILPQFQTRLNEAYVLQERLKKGPQIDPNRPAAATTTEMNYLQTKIHQLEKELANVNKHNLILAQRMMGPINPPTNTSEPRPKSATGATCGRPICPHGKPMPICTGTNSGNTGTCVTDHNNALCLGHYGSQTHESKQKSHSSKPSSKHQKHSSCCSGKRSCGGKDLSDDELENRIKVIDDYDALLKRKLAFMESKIKQMQHELAQIHVDQSCSYHINNGWRQIHNPIEC